MWGREHDHSLPSTSLIVVSNLILLVSSPVTVMAELSKDLFLVMIFRGFLDSDDSFDVLAAEETEETECSRLF